MLPKVRVLLTALVALALVAGAAQADLTDSLKKGTPDLKSIGPINFGADGVIFVGDTTGAAIFAIDTGDKGPAAGTDPVKVENIDAKVASLLGIDKAQVQIRDVAVNPASGNVYLSVARGTGPTAAPVLLKLDRKGKLDEFSLKDVKFSKAALPNASEKARQDSITCIAFVKGKVYVAGLSNEEFASTLRAIPFPFADVDKGTGVEIYHGAHGALETRSPVRTFIPFEAKGETHLLAGYQCTPLVRFPVSDLKPGAKIQGTTIAELGNGNRPLDMVIYEKGGKEYLLIANNKRGIMKAALEGMEKLPGINKKIGGTAGLPYDKVDGWGAVEQMAKLDKDRALVLVRTGSGLNLDTVPLP